MNILRRHIASSVLSAVAVVLLVIVALDALAVLIEQAGDMRGGYGMARVLQCVAYRIPGFIVANIGFAILIGCLAGLGMLANQNELTVMRASGVSIAQIVFMLFRPAALVMILGVALGEVSPYLDRTAEGLRDQSLAAQPAPLAVHTRATTLTAHLQENLRAGSQQLNLIPEPVRERNVWNRDGNDFVRFATVLPQGQVYGVTRYHFDDNRLLAWVQTAASGTYDNGVWVLRNVRTTYYDKVLRDETQESVSWPSRLSPELLTFVSTEPENLTSSELGRYGDFLQAQQRDNRAYELQWWKRVCKPLEILSLVLVAVFFVFGSLRQVTIGQRIFIGVLAGVAFQTLENMATTASLVYGFHPLLAVLLPVVLCALLGAAMLSRVR